MPYYVILITVFALILVRKINFEGTFKLTYFCIGLSISFIAIMFFVKFSVAKTDLISINNATERLKHALSETHAERDKPLILFVGASHSYRGLISSLVEKNLNKDGLNYNVVNLSVGGMGILEQDYYIDLYMKKTSVAPQMIFFEVSKRFENPIREYTRPGIDNRILPITDYTRLNWLVKYMRSSANYEVLPHVIYLFVLNLLSIDHVHGDFFANVEPLHQEFRYGTQINKKGHTSNFTQDDIDGWSVSELAAIKPAAINNKTLKWIEQFRNYQNQKLTMLGVKKIAFYAPPMIPEDYHAYAKSICGLLQCVMMKDQTLKKRLAGPYWYNFTHLNEDGAKIYSAWLGQTLFKYIALNLEPV